MEKSEVIFIKTLAKREGIRDRHGQTRSVDEYLFHGRFPKPRRLVNICRYIRTKKVNPVSTVIISVSRRSESKAEWKNRRKRRGRREAVSKFVISARLSTSEFPCAVLTCSLSPRTVERIMVESGRINGSLDEAKFEQLIL